MYHVFQTSSVARGPGSGELTDGLKTTRPTGSRRISTSNACVECRRRKIRCDGTKPCSQCQWYQHPGACSYSKPTQRVVPSRKLVEKLSSTIDQYQTVISRLFPSKTIESLSSLPREDLLSLALSLPTSSTSSPATGEPHNQRIQTQSRSDGTDSLDTLEQAADHDGEDLIKSIEPITKLQSISDDVNGLSMSDRHSSYVGISSITAAMKVIMKTAPNARIFTTLVSTDTAQPSRASSPPLETDDLNGLPPLAEGQRLLASYFEHVHPFFPMLDEKAFRKTYMLHERSDGSWMGLLNMVFALGSLAAGTSENVAHLNYFRRTREYLNMEHMLPGSFERLQTLGMMGGYYVHYLNRPNEAHAILQAALSIACSLGLHREYPGERPTSTANGADGSNIPVHQGSKVDSRLAEMRRRAWWSLYCLEAWATTTSGRPSIGTSPAITVREPGEAPHQTLDPNDPESLKTLPLIHNAPFCKISLKIQDRLATTPLLPFEELLQFDQDLVRWYEELPSMLTTDKEETIPSYLRTPRTVMNWRFQNLRIVLHRPFLLSTALKRTSPANMTAEEKIAVKKCRQAAEQTIEDISAGIKEELISGWNGVWLAYQAAFVPLISLFTDDAPVEEKQKWHASIATALSIFERMKHYSVAAKNSFFTISGLLEAAKATIEQREAEKHQKAAQQKVNEDPQRQSQARGKNRLGKIRTESQDSGDYYLSTSGTSADGSMSPHDLSLARSVKSVKLEPRPPEPLALAPEYHEGGARLQRFIQANQMQPNINGAQMRPNLMSNVMMQAPLAGRHHQPMQGQPIDYSDSIDMSFNGVWDNMMWDTAVPMAEDAFGLTDFEWENDEQNQTLGSWGWPTT
ncbi:hypothetical protein P152DRAFT_418407 [Eremomyces bilateralis CBS 781.70]|uniref:Zn(2)-C6 fungal-type domain-containing protein n=1 Tax=Eremomyces bilateralis CBS 781.70 TaxID=1392243 RepID=A0A6G1G0V0_9PEZI|nr:uncharacterized protein P152DRAFT_418407 [Eremomyces bilateralis CBS 781.70]KAF1811737.1 hypothetical protein P152DRAFT_418407 [Eremomyces bilateralis CBS 781.70]